MISESQAPQKFHKNEGIKKNSNYLRGTILEGLTDVSTGSLSADDQQLTKFHGIYQQDDRDVRNERRKQKLDKAYTFMARIGLPGGVCTPVQWTAVSELAEFCGACGRSLGSCFTLEPLAWRPMHLVTPLWGVTAMPWKLSI